MITDAHHHLWDPDRRLYPWMADSALDPIRRRYTVDDLRAAVGPDVAATVLVQTVSSVDETIEFLATARESGGFVAGVVGWVDLACAARAEVLDDELLVGVRHQVEDEPDERWLLRPDVQRGLRRLCDRALPYDLLVRAPQRAAALETVSLLHDVGFVLDHAGKPDIADGEWDCWADWISRLAERPNVVCKLSGLVTLAARGRCDIEEIRPYAEHVLDAFGADRVLFGSDWPVCELAATYGEVLSLAGALLTGASAGERAAVLGGTARRVYRLGAR